MKMKRLVITGCVVLGLTSAAWGQSTNGQCEEANSRLQAAVTEAQNGMIQKIIMQGELTLLKQQVKALQDEKAASNGKAETHPKAESATPPPPGNSQ